MKIERRMCLQMSLCICIWTIQMSGNKRRQHVKICQALRENRLEGNVSELEMPAITIGLNCHTTVIHSELSIKDFGFRYIYDIGECINHQRRTSARRVCIFTPHKQLSIVDIRNYMLQNDGKVTNHALVKHFKKYLTHTQSESESRNIYDCMFVQRC